MKLKIKKTFLLAQPEVAKPHWSFKEGEILDTDNEYLIDRLLILKCADIVDKNNSKMMSEHENKMLDTSTKENKVVEIVAPKQPGTISQKPKKVQVKKKGS